ncbi:SprT family protein [Kurthia sibirica]|uniref:SprT family protein n=1 Tax=Kurthia sibirica TaxID=202750 RepID=A0A2U3AK34_9BACL|nr:SprT family protein [Kurthia sibirica]PWI24883.1 SprT family protein [Kurthia sibirica]GEK33214.1 protein SprT [Kurthia sibirica]
MTDEELTDITKAISIEYFYKPFNHLAYFNSRLKTTGGRYLLRTHNIDINRAHYNHFGMEELIGIIKHELCHYHLHIEGKGYRHSDKDFKELLKRSGSPRHCSSLQTVTYYRYECEKCHLIYQRKRKVNTEKYSCGKCSGRILKKD